jgi:putative ABC transport system ATP-binding protein
MVAWQTMDKSLFRYVWRHSKRDQLLICAVVVASLPFYFASLDLPRRIVNEAIQGKAFGSGQTTAQFLTWTFSLPSWLGGFSYKVFEGFAVEQLELLMGLSGLFLLLVLVNGAFKYWINVSKGALGERMLRRMRFELFTLVLRFTPEALRHVKASETATIIKDEVEPIGGFIGDAFILPAFLGTQAATALIFILVQNLWLGLMAGGVVGIQFVVIPRLRRELLRLGRQRQIASRRLAGRISEVMDGIEVVHVHNAASWERAEIGHRLFQLFDLRYRIYKRKFVVKFLNNLLAQVTPFLFYSVGGYLALKGRLDIGQLVAVVGAYRELPPPLKELIDWDQQRLDVQVKYDQVVQHFAPERLAPEPTPEGEVEEMPISGPLVVADLRVMDPHGTPLIDGASFECPLPARVGIVGDGPAGSVFARILARRTPDYVGEVKLGDRNVAELPRAVVGRQIAYAGVDPILFPGTLRDNIVYGLRYRPVRQAEEDARERARRITEARRTGNPVETVADDWIDLEMAGAKDADELDRIIIDLLHRMDMEEDVYRFGLSGMVDPGRHPNLAQRIIEARLRLREVLQASGMAELVEPFDPARYNAQATVAENLLFGVPTSPALTGRNLAEHPGFREALERQGLIENLIAMGARIAETMTEIFRGLPPGHPLFEQFSFIGADELADFEAIVRQRARRGGTKRKESATRLLALPLGYIEPRHRLDLLDDALKERFVAARPVVREILERSGDPGVEFYDQERVSAAAPLRDNLLFGRISHNAASAQTRVTEAITGVVDELGLRADVERVGLDHQVGASGRLLSAPQRASVSLARCLVKRPDLLVVDGGLVPLGETRARRMLAMLLEVFEQASLFVVLPNDRDLGGFDAIIRIGQGRAEVEPMRESDPPPAPDKVDRREKRLAGAAS